LDGVRNCLTDLPSWALGTDLKEHLRPRLHAVPIDGHNEITCTQAIRLLA